MHVLLVLPDPPLPEGRANGRCMIGRLRGLREHGIRVTTIAARQIFSLAGDPPSELAVNVMEVQPASPGWSTRINRVRRPRGELGRGEFAAAVRALARQVDVVHLEEIDTAWCDIGVTTPSLIQLNYLVRNDRPIGWPWRSEFRELVELVLAERAALRRHRWIGVNSGDVASKLHGLALKSEVVVAPLCLDPQYYQVANFDGAPTVGFIGDARWPPTAASVRRLVADVWPIIRRHVPTARLRLAGRGMSALLTKVAAAGVEVIGEVESGAAFLRELAVMVYPIEHGSGMKVKTLESLAVGLPVVTTPSGAEGIMAGDGVIIARADELLAAATAELLLDQAARVQRGRAARNMFERAYTPKPATVPLVDFYHRMTRAG